MCWAERCCSKCYCRLQHIAPRFLNFLNYIWKWLDFENQRHKIAISFLICITTDKKLSGNCNCICYVHGSVTFLTVWSFNKCAASASHAYWRYYCALSLVNDKCKPMLSWLWLLVSTLIKICHGEHVSKQTRNSYKSCWSWIPLTKQERTSLFIGLNMSTIFLAGINKL